MNNNCEKGSPHGCMFATAVRGQKTEVGEQKADDSSQKIRDGQIMNQSWIGLQNTKTYKSILLRSLMLCLLEQNFDYLSLKDIKRKSKL